MEQRPALLRDAEFLKYWSSQTVYGLGIPISQLAIPIVAVSSLHASATQMGILGAAETAAFLVVGLPAGVIVDRSRRLPLMVGLNAFGIAALALVPLATALGILRLELLYVVAFLGGCVGVVWAVASQAFIPTLVGRARLVEANSRMQLSYSAGQVAGPGAGGLLIQAFSAPFAIVAALVLEAVGTLVMWTIRARETVRPHPGTSLVSQVREGLDIVFSDRHVRAIMLCGTTHNIFCNGMLVAIYVLYATRFLGVTPAELGIVFAVAGPGAVVGSLLSDRIPRAIGLGPAIGAMQIATGISRLGMPLAAMAVSVVPPFVILAAGEFTLAIARTVFNVNQLSLRQSITPDHQQGRMNASIRFVMWAVVPFGALLGGWLGDAIGMLPAIWIGVAGTFLAALWIYLTPVRALRDAPQPIPA